MCNLETLYTLPAMPAKKQSAKNTGIAFFLYEILFTLTDPLRRHHMDIAAGLYHYKMTGGIAQVFKAFFRLLYTVFLLLHVRIDTPGFL